MTAAIALSAPRERPILFKGEMVRAILDGRKTQTRRLMRPQPAALCRYEMNGAGTHALHLGPPLRPGETMSFVPPTPRSTDHRLPCPYGEPGDRLWVKETYQIIHVSIDPETGYGDDVEAAPKIPKDDRGGWWSRVWRATDDQADYHPDDRGFVWRSPLHMPRWASRITLEIAEVRVQRLQEISEEDARAEGVRVPDAATKRQDTVDTHGMTPYRAAFACLWESINGRRIRRVWDDATEEWRTVIDTSARWEANPWIWALTLRRLP